MERVQVTDICWLWLGGKTTNGYGEIRYHGRDYYVHRLSWELHRSAIPKGLWVLHHCDVRHCVKPDHLYLGTHRDNMRDMRDRKRWNHDPATRARGERHGLSKLNTKQVKALRKRRATGITISQLARESGVARSTIRRAVNGDTWRGVIANAGGG
jgi:hypothetical protein